MRDDDKYMWIPMLALFVGMGLPGIFVDFAEDSWQERIWIGIFTSTAMFSYAVFKKIGIKYPRLRNWGINTLTGATITIFFSSLLAALRHDILYYVAALLLSASKYSISPAGHAPCKRFRICCVS